MKYYRVKSEFDNKNRYTHSRDGVLTLDGILVGGELYTPCEFKRLANNPNQFEIVEVSRKKTGFIFGARFELKREGASC